MTTAYLNYQSEGSDLVLTTSEDRPAGRILFGMNPITDRPFWTAQPIPSPRLGTIGLRPMIFRSLEAAKYYMLAAAIESEV